MTFEQLREKTYYLKMHQVYNNGNLEVAQDVRLQCINLLTLVNDCLSTGYYTGEHYESLWDRKRELIATIKRCNYWLRINEDCLEVLNREREQFAVTSY